MIKKILQMILACGLAWGFLVMLAMGMDKEIARQEIINNEMELLRMCWQVTPDKAKKECLKG